MDTELLRTFLEVQRTRHFGQASRNLFVTQSAVSARVKLLEETLGVRLFSRMRDNIHLTPEGKRLLKSAEAIVNLWEEARNSVTLAARDQPQLVVGGVASLWDIYLPDWVDALHAQIPDLALRCETHGTESLVQGVLAKTVDLGFLFDPPRFKELVVQEFTPVELIMVSTREGLSALDAVRERYVMVDWGASFAAEHARWFPELPPPMLHLDRVGQALHSLLAFGGSGYMARPMAAVYLEEGRLFSVTDAPPFSRTAFALSSEKSDNKELVQQALDLLS